VGALFYNGNLKNNSRKLRNNMTDAERRLWSKLRLQQLNGRQFYRQRIVGPYIVDFVCPTENIVVEVDGSQHYSNDGLASDNIRDKYLNSRGLEVLRFNDTDVLNNTEGVVERILEHLNR
jgi:very-short-patch-repair endonuclease